MKKILSTAAVFTASAVLLSASAFACPLKQNTACHIQGNLTGAAAPVSYIVAPVQKRTYVPPCNSCAKKENKTIFQKVMTPFTGIYDAVFMPFTNLYD